MARWLHRACVAVACATAALATTLMPGAVCAQSLDHGEVDKLYTAASRKVESSWGTQRREVEWIGGLRKGIPGIEVQFLGDNDIAVKAIAEARAGRHQVDVYQNSLTGTLPVMQRDLMGVVDWSPFGIDKRNVAFDGKMAYTSNIVYTVAYNNKLVKDADAPRQWADILDERYRGKGASSTFLLPRLIGALGLAWGEEKRCNSRATSWPNESPAHTGATRIAVAIGRAPLRLRRRSTRSFVRWPPRVFRSARWCRSRWWSGSSG